MRIYIAGPYTKGDVVLNVRQAIAAGETLWALGHQPYVPHLTHFWHLVFPHPPPDWYAFDLPWLRQCEALLRLPGDSWGADREVEEAKRLGLPVYSRMEDVPPPPS